MSNLEKLPPSGGDVVGADLERRARGWEISAEGLVTIPKETMPADTFNVVRDVVEPHALSFVARMSDSIASGLIATENRAADNKWKEAISKDGKFQQVFANAKASGNTANLPQEMVAAYKEFVQEFKDERGKQNFFFVLDRFRQFEEQLGTLTDTSLMTLGKEVGREYLTDFKKDRLLQIREDPFKGPRVVNDLIANQDLFYLGNVGRQEAEADFAKTVQASISESLSFAGLRDPEQAKEMLETWASEGLISGPDYALWTKRIAVAQRAALQAREAADEQSKAIDNVIETARQPGTKVLDSKLRASIDVFDAYYEHGEDQKQSTETFKASVYQAMGYVPEGFKARMWDNMHSGNDLERQEAMQNVLAIDTNLPPMARRLPTKVVAYAKRLQDLSVIADPTKAWQETSEIMKKWEQRQPAERADIEMQTADFLNRKDEKTEEDKWKQIDRAVLRLVYKEPGLLGLYSHDKKIEYDSLTGNFSPEEEMQWDREIRQRMNAYVMTGMLRDTALNHTIADLQKEWGATEAAGTKAYPAYKPIEKTLIFQEDVKPKQRQAMIYRAIEQNFGALLPVRPADLRLLYSRASSKDESVAIYDVFYREQMKGDHWLPLVNKNKKQVQINTGEFFKPKSKTEDAGSDQLRSAVTTEPPSY